MIIHKMSLILGLFILSMGATSPAQADFENWEAFMAYSRGDYETALKEWLVDANRGDAEAQNMLGDLYYYGEGVPQNYKEAMRWYLLAADQGYAEAQYNIGIMYFDGEGVPRNYIASYMWLNLAVAQGDVLASMFKKAPEKLMTPEQIAEAQRLSAEWLEEHQ